MSANAEILGGPAGIGVLAADEAPTQVAILAETHNWNPEEFAREQIRGLVRRVFFASAVGPVKQVVFSAAGPSRHVGDICDRVGQALALETSADIAIVGRNVGEAETIRGPRIVGSSTIKSCSTQTAINLWHVPAFDLRENGEASRTGRYWLTRLAELRNEFEYSVIHGPAAGTTNEAALLAELADGIVLVVGANSTRKATARRIKDALEETRSRILGTVLSDRTFPIPERIYRRL